MEAEREYRLLCMWRNYQLWVQCLHPRKPQRGTAKGTWTWTSCGIVLVQLWKCTATLPSLQFPSVCISVEEDLHLFCWLEDPDWHLGRKEASLFSFRLDPFISGTPVFLPRCHFFFNAFWGYFFIPFIPTRLNISIFWPLGFVAQQGLCRRVFSHGAGPAFSRHPSAVCRVSCGAKLFCFVLMLVLFLAHAALGGCHPSWGLGDCCPQGEWPFLPPQSLLLFAELRFCTHGVPVPQGSHFPICGQCPLEHFAEEKVTRNRREWEKSFLIWHLKKPQSLS